MNLEPDSPLAQEARRLISAAEYTAARELLQRGPLDPAAEAEFARLECLTGHETRAAQRWAKLEPHQRPPSLTQILGDHFTLRAELDPTDREARVKLNVLGSAYSERSPHIGLGIAAVLIVKNEEAHLARCLASLQGVAQEIIVVDTGSTDATVKIAHQFGASVHHFEWIQDFAAARNAALEKATEPWCLWIDADEVITPESVKAIDRARTRPHLGGFEIEIVNYTEDRENGSEFRHYPVRLFRNLPGVRFEGRVHEQVTQSLLELGLTWVRLPGARLLHDGYRPSQMVEKLKIQRTLALLQKQLEENPRDPFAWFNMANTHAVAQQWQETGRAARQCVDLMPVSAPYGLLAYQLLAQSALFAGEPEATLAACDEAEARGFGGILTSFERGQAQMRLNQLEAAIISFDLCLTRPWPEGMTGDRGIATHKARILKAQTLTLLNRLEDAEKEIQSALAVDPGYGPARYTQGAILERRGTPAEAFRAYSLALQDPDSRLLALKGAARCASLTGDLRNSAQLFRTAYEADNSDEESWLGWVTACQSLGDTDGLLQAYEIHAQHQGSSAEILINWGRTLEAAGEPDRAVQCFVEAMQRDPGCANAYFNCADLLYRHGRPQDAAHLYRAGLQHDPLNAEAWFTLGNSLANSGHDAGAIDAFRKALSIDPSHQKAIHNLAVMLEDAA